MNKLYQKVIEGQEILPNSEEVAGFYLYLKCEQKALPQLKQIATALYQKASSQGFKLFQSLSKDIQNGTLGTDESEWQIAKDILLCFSAICMTKAIQTDSFELSQKAKYYYNLSEGINALSRQASILLKANILFYRGDISEAFELVKLNIQHYQGEVTIGNHLLLVQIFFARRQYEKALDELKRWLRFYKDLPIKARVVMAHCYYNLNKFQLAVACFKRILRIDEKCVEALIGLAVISQKNEEYENYFQYLQAACKIEQSHPLVLLHLAEHFLLLRNIEEIDKVRKLARRGLEAIQTMAKIEDGNQAFRNDYYQFQERFNNMLGQTFHIKGLYRQALKYYRSVSKKKTACSSWNRIQQIQCYIALGDYKSALYSLQVHMSSSNYLGQLHKDSRMFNDTNRLIAYLQTKSDSSPQTLNSISYYFQEAIKFNKTDYFLKCEFVHFLTTYREFDKARTIFEQVFEDMMQSQTEQISSQMFNNMGVILIECNQLEKAKQMLEQALARVREERLREADKIGIELVVLYNSGICAQYCNLFQTAIQIYCSIIERNRGFIDAYLRLANVYWLVGNRQACKGTLANALQESRLDLKLCHQDRIRFPQSYYAIKQNKFIQADSFYDCITQKSNYTKIFGICLQFQKRVIQQQDCSDMVSFLKEYRQECEILSWKDPQSAFIVFVFLTLTLKLHEVSKKYCQTIGLTGYQVYEAFKNLQQSLDKKHVFPVIYNTAIYQMLGGRLDSAVAILKQILLQDYSEISSLIACCQMLGGQTAAAIKTAKIALLFEPAEAKTQHQLHFLALKMCRDVLPLDQSNFNVKKLKFKNSKTIKACCKYFQHIAKNDLSSLEKISNAQQKELQLAKNRKIRQLALALHSEAERVDKLYETVRKQAKKEEERQISQIYIKMKRETAIHDIPVQNNPKHLCQTSISSLKRPLQPEKAESGETLSKKLIISCNLPKQGSKNMSSVSNQALNPSQMTTKLIVQQLAIRIHKKKQQHLQEDKQSGQIESSSEDAKKQ